VSSRPSHSSRAPSSSRDPRGLRGPSHGDGGVKLALVHDYLTEMGGAERVVESLVSIFPGVPLYTSACDRDLLSPPFHGIDIRTTFVQRLTHEKRRTKALFPLLPLAFRTLDLADFDAVLSSSSGFAHHVRPRPDAVHVCYCHNPPRFLWQPHEYFRDEAVLKTVLGPALSALRRLDVSAARRVDAYVANSATVAERIRATYGRNAEIIHPPVETAAYRPSDERSGRFLVVSRLLPYKRIDLVIEAASRRNLPVDVIGDGPDLPRLQGMAGDSVRFLGRQPDPVVRHALARCVALVVPGTEDFGLTPVEAQASGRPPVAFAAGGALETIEDACTGFLFREQSWEAVAEAMQRARAVELSRDCLRTAAERFDIALFKDRLEAFLAQQVEAKRRRSDAD
jgi:glycosyltransferase involved in cell wall biosynthesis